MRNILFIAFLIKLIYKKALKCNYNVQVYICYICYIIYNIFVTL